MKLSQDKLTVLTTIVNQLGGREFTALTAATYGSQDDGNTLVVKFKGSPKANIMYITLTPLDLYDVRICRWKIRKFDFIIEEVASATGLYNDQLADFFETTTGLYTTLLPKKQ